LPLAKALAVVTDVVVTMAASTAENELVFELRQSIGEVHSEYAPS
jgi:hypothetical protein